MKKYFIFKKAVTLFGFSLSLHLMTSAILPVEGWSSTVQSTDFPSASSYGQNESFQIIVPDMGQAGDETLLSISENGKSSAPPGQIPIPGKGDQDYALLKGDFSTVGWTRSGHYPDFNDDSDDRGVRPDANSPPSLVPLPSALLLSATGFAGLAGIYIRKWGRGKFLQ